MAKTILTFIEDEELRQEIKKVLDTAQSTSEVAEDNIYSNVIDPFSAVFDSQRQGITPSDWLQQEKAR